MATTTKRKRSSDKQQYIPGTEPPRIKELDTLAIDYREQRDIRQAALVQEVDLKNKLLAAMREHGLEVYPVPDTDVEVVLEHGEDTVKVRKRKEAKA